MIPGLGGIAGMVGAALSPARAFITANSIVNTGKNAFTFASTPIGSPSTDRIVVVAATSRSSGGHSITGVTIGGVAATQATGSSGEESATGIWYLSVPSGTQADIVVTTSAACYGASISVYSLTGLSSAAPHDAQSTTTSGAAPSVNVSVSSGGLLIAVAQARGTGSTATWTGATQDSAGVVTGYGQYSAASAQSLATEAARAISASLSGGIRSALSAASWN